MKYLLILKDKLMRIQFLFFLILMSACTDIIQIADDSMRDEILVVEGEVSDEQGPYQVKLSTTTSVGGLGNNTLGIGANVIIEEDTGKEEVLREVRPGVYQTQVGGIQGQIGNSYKVKITLVNGEQYESVFESMPEPVEIASLNTEFIDERFTVNGFLRRTIGHKLSVELVKERAIKKFFRFQIQGIQESEVSFEPMICSLPTPSIRICYSFRNPIKDGVKAFNDTNISKDSYSLDIAFIPVEQKRRYLANVEVKSFSPEAYNFWSDLQKQLAAEGNIFDPPIPPIIGNVKNITTGVFAQGYFTTASISRDKVCVDRSKVLITSRVPTACAGRNCLQVWSPATFDMPDFSFCQ